MQKEKYRKQSEQMTKSKILKYFAFLVILLFLLLVILALILNTKQKPKYNMEMAVKETLENLGCTFLKIKNSKEKNFVYDVDVIFKVDLYENETSQQPFYEEVIQRVAENLQYQNFRLIDNNKNEPIEIRVICSQERIQKIIINGMEDYFIYMDSQKSLEKYTEIKKVKLSVGAPELVQCLQNGWNPNVDFGTREAIFQKYYIYLDEGIEMRKINGKIYNVIFTENYTKSVVNGFTVGTKRDIIERELGVPSFQNEDKSIIGYKTDELYIFFEDTQISIYRNTQESGFDVFFELTDKFLKEEYTLLEFMNELTDVWPDYEEYEYDSNRAFLSYPNKGIDIKINHDNMNGIVLYNNIGISQEEVNGHLKNTEFMARLQLDNVFLAEERRVSKINDFQKKCREYQQKFEAEDTRNRGEIYDYYADISDNNQVLCFYFISQNASYPNCELSENIKSYIWAAEDYFIYSVERKGIYYYDLKNQTKGKIITGEDTFEIKSWQNGLLSYDDKTIPINQ